MSVLQVDSFDGYVTSEIPNYWHDQANAGAAAIGTPARTGVSAMNPKAGGVARDTGVLLFNAIVGAAFLPAEQGGPIFAFSQGLGVPTFGIPFQCTLQMLNSGAIGVQQSANGPILGTSDSSLSVLQAGIYNYVEWRTSFSIGGGLNQIWINGQLVLSMFLNTCGQPFPGANTVWLLGAGGGAQDFFDDYYLVNPDDGVGLVTAAGDSSVICSITSANGDTDQWIPNPGTNANWQNVHQIPSSNGLMYNRSAGTHTADDYQVTPQLLLTDDILAVQLTHVTFSDGSGEIAEPFLNIQGVPFDDTGHLYEPSTGAYTPTMFIYERNPLGGGTNPWTGVSFNATNWGIGQGGHPANFAFKLGAVHNVNRASTAGSLIP